MEKGLQALREEEEDDDDERNRYSIHLHLLPSVYFTLQNVSCDLSQLVNLKSLLCKCGVSSFSSSLAQSRSKGRRFDLVVGHSQRNSLFSTL